MANSIEPTDPPSMEPKLPKVVARVTFTLEETVVVEGESLEAIQKAADDLADDGMPNWDTDDGWAASVRPLPHHQVGRIKPHFTVVGGEIVLITGPPHQPTTEPTTDVAG